MTMTLNDGQREFYDHVHRYAAKTGDRPWQAAVILMAQDEAGLRDDHQLNREQLDEVVELLYQQQHGGQP